MVEPVARQIISPLVSELVADAVELGMARAEMVAVPEASWRCDVCPKRLINRHSLTKHRRNGHENPGHCDICEKYFSSAVKIAYHKQFVHSDAKVFLWSTCGYQSSLEH